jgi:hypothetical protein
MSITTYDLEQTAVKKTQAETWVLSAIRFSHLRTPGLQWVRRISRPTAYWLAAAGAASASEAPFFTFFFFGFFTCFSVGAEYDVAGLASCGAAGWANDGCASAATPNAVNINISFFIRFLRR